jgi:predicted esterase
MTREDRLSEFDDYVDYLDTLAEHVQKEVGPGEALRFVALGFSQGTATISRWAARTTTPPDELVLWGGGLPPELEPAALGERWKRTRVTMVVGTRDRWLRESQLVEATARLAAHGVVTRVLRFEGGHRLDDETLLTVAEG